MPNICECLNGAERGAFDTCSRCGGEYASRRGRSLSYGVATGDERSTFQTAPAAPGPRYSRALGRADEQGRVTFTVDLTPSWGGLLPGLLAALDDGTPGARRVAREELQRMALAADAYVAISKKAAGL